MEIVAETKVCKKCGVEKAVEEFHIDRNLRDGRKTRCRICTNKTKAKWRGRNRDVIVRQKKESYQRNRERYINYNRSDVRRERVFRWKLKRQFGITEEQFDAMLKEQNGCCAICGLEPSEASGHRNKHRLHVDHDHVTGKVRGLLCNNCNAGIGYLAHEPDRLLSAYEYLTTR
jgi:hypothetical protein